jgi:hypothetical protein
MVHDSVDATVTRGQESWTYIYIVLGFTLSIEGTSISLITPLAFPWNLILYAVIGAATFWMFINNGRFQDKIFGWKAKYEQKAR